MKSTILLTTAIFLLSAPAPDSKTLSDMSAGLLAPKNESGLLASEDVSKNKNIVQTSNPKKPNPKKDQDRIKL